jgi:hypothetical protein
MATTALRTYTARSGSSATNSTTVALVAATAKSVVGVLGASSDTINLVHGIVSFSSATSTDAPAVVEFGLITALGTTTSFTPVQQTGIVVASSATAGYNATVEPTYSRILKTLYVPVFNGTYEFWNPLGFEPQAAASQGFAIRVTSPSATNCYAALTYGE